ncbi:hypothetical protein [Amycolatopsis vastitatis]|uniref:Uncharacterized protein n=1 Tax=Amycolatopsis vastitatis TaxID=1905142 RepID=A0A229TFC4_9PSEU|nr:hypothetical protein [Amycolatopsis vastitatis]OXM69651.1 hypothetical protein CF165_09080 [Amycolatopsis vastitatis]
MVTVTMTGKFIAEWFDGTSVGQGTELDTPERQLLWEIYRDAPERRYGRNGSAHVLTFPTSLEGLGALDALFDYADTGVQMTNDDPEDSGTNAACRVMVERALIAVRELEKQLGVEPGTVTLFGIRR